MTQKVNMYASPNRDSKNRVFTRDGPSVDEEALTEEVTSRVDLDAYLDRHYEVDEVGSGFVGTVTIEDDGYIGSVRIAEKVHENPIV